jgi:hypothetical protein
VKDKGDLIFVAGERLKEFGAHPEAPVFGDKIPGVPIKQGIIKILLTGLPAKLYFQDTTRRTRP